MHNLKVGQHKVRLERDFTSSSPKYCKFFNILASPEYFATYISSLTFAIRVILNSISAIPPTGIRSLPVQKRNSFRLREFENFPTVSQKYLENSIIMKWKYYWRFDVNYSVIPDYGLRSSI